MLNSTQFSKWYHGTSPENVESIRTKGLTAASYSRDNPVLSADKEMAHASGSSIVTIHMPDHLLDRYFHDSVARDTGIRKPIPPEMIS